MIKEIGYYSLIQFCPDPVAAESVNIGLLAFCPKTGFVDVYVTKDNKRVFRAFGFDICNNNALQIHKEGLRQWILSEHSRFTSLEKAREFISEQVNQIIFTDPRPTVWIGGAKEGSLRLFNKLLQEKENKIINHITRYSPKQKIISKLKGKLGNQFNQRIYTELPALETVDSDNTVKPLFGFQNNHFNVVFARFFTEKNYATEIMKSTFIADALKYLQYNKQSKTCPVFLCRITSEVKPKIQVIQDHFNRHDAKYYDDETALVEHVLKEAEILPNLFNND
jgi:hypothetical protein